MIVWNSVSQELTEAAVRPGGRAGCSPRGTGRGGRQAGGTRDSCYTRAGRRNDTDKHHPEHEQRRLNGPLEDDDYSEWASFGSGLIWTFRRFKVVKKRSSVENPAQERGRKNGKRKAWSRLTNYYWGLFVRKVWFLRRSLTATFVTQKFVFVRWSRENRNRFNVREQSPYVSKRPR